MTEFEQQLETQPTDQEEPPYTLTIDLNVLKHLGINLYSNVPAVLTEIVANAWDAEASTVEITVQDDLDSIEILDSGYGMDRAAINGKFLWVGYDKRNKDGEYSPVLLRPVMGRKGVGKLAPFSIANTVEVYSNHNGAKCALRMTVKGITEAVNAVPKRPYHPEPLSFDRCPEGNGTRIVLKDLKREKIRIENLSQRLARRFSVIGTEGFKVFIKKGQDSREITSRDRGDLQRLQYMWTIGGWQPPTWLADTNEANILRTDVLPSRLDSWDEKWNIKGWIGTAYKPKDLDSVSGNLNVIVILARGRLFQESMLGEVSDGRHYLKYLVGHLEADFLDNDPNDIATSDRQRVQEDDPRYIALKSYLISVLGKIEKSWSAWRVLDKVEEVKKFSPQINAWLSKFSGGHRKHAENLIGKISSFDIEDPQEEKALLRHAILGFERLRISGNAQELAAAINVGSAELLPLLADIDAYEASLYRDIVNGRLDVIKSFSAKIKGNELEKTLQEYMFEHLWLIDPSWERAKGSEIIEKPVNHEFDKITAGLSDEERAGRVDIKYRKTSGKHVIIELKRPGRTVSAAELAQQGYKYVSALRKCLKERDREHEPYEVIFIIGKPLKEEGDQQFIDHQFSSVNGRAVQFMKLLESAEEGYREYLEAKGNLDATQRLLDSLS